MPKASAQEYCSTSNGHVAGTAHEIQLIFRSYRQRYAPVSASYPSPAWKFQGIEIPRPTHRDYIYSLEIMDRKEARRTWRDGIKAAWDNRCAFCNGIPIDDESLTLDHLRPRSRGGQDLTRNIVPACSSCNASKGSQDMRLWYELQPFYCPVRAKEIESWMTQGDRNVDEWWETGVGDLEWCITEIARRESQQAA